MKKNRRGLGRGIEALIQSTAPEQEASDGIDATDATLSSGATGAADSTVTTSDLSESTAQRRTDDPVERAASRNRTPAEAVESTTSEPVSASTQTDESADTAPRDMPDDSSEDARGSADRPDLMSRYLSGRPSAGDTPVVPRETRRPVDVFFPDRRAGENVDLVGPGTGQRRPRSRPSMPALQPSTASGTAKANGNTGRDVRRQLDQVEPAVHGTAPSEQQLPSETSAPQETGSTTPATGRSMGSSGEAELRSIPVADIHPNPRQPRDVFDEDDMDELVASIGQVGVLQPVVVRQVEGPSPFELVMGERRWRASQRAGLTEIPAIVRHTADTDLLRDALLENLHRSQLNPLEEAAAYEQLLEDFNCTQDELSSRIGRSRPQITNTLRLLRLPPLVQRRVASGVLSAGHARALLSLVDPAEMERLAQKVVSEGLSVRATEELVSLQDGVRQVKPQSRNKRTDRHERLDYLANSLTDRLDTTVKITLGARKGKIAIDFASVDDLNRIMDLIGQSEVNGA